MLLDLNLPGVRGFDALDRFRHEQPSMPVVILSMHRDRETVLEAIRRGAMGFIPKASVEGIDRQRGAARSVGRSLSAAGSGYVRRPIRSCLGRPGAPFAKLALTLRPWTDSRVRGRCLHSSCAANPTRRSAGRSGIAERTVKVHVTAVLEECIEGDKPDAGSDRGDRARPQSERAMVAEKTTDEG